MRRVLAPVLVITAALGLAACGDPKDLSQDQVKSSVVDASAAGDGYTAAEIKTDKPTKSSDDSDPFKDSKDVSQSCKDADKALSDASKADPKAYATRTLTKGSGTSMEGIDVVVEVLDKASDVPDKAVKVADECKEMTLKEVGTEVKVKTTSPDLGVDGAKAMQMDMSAAGQQESVLMGLKAIGHNLVVVQSSGKDEGHVKDVVTKVLKAQADKVDKAAS